MKTITTFPSVVPVKNGSYGTEAVVLAVANCNYVGYTRATNSHDHPSFRATAVWDSTGKCLYTGAGDNDSYGRARRSLKLTEDGQDQYDKLTVDQRAILAALFHAEKNTNHLGLNYLQETLKVDVNLAAQVLTYANKKDFK